MRRNSRRPVAVAIAALALVVAAGLPTVPASAGISAPAAAALTVTPDTLLVNNQFVTVAGTGYPTGTQVAMAQCKPAPVDASGCDLSTTNYVTSDGTGAFSVGFRVKRLMRVGAETIDCAAAGACIIGAGAPPSGPDPLPPIDGAGAPIQFDPTVPLPPPPVVTVSPSTMLLNNQTVTVTGGGYEPGSGVGIVQCRTPSNGPEDCDLGNVTFVSPGADGTFTTSFSVRRLISVGGQALDCAQPGLCEIGAGSGLENGAQAPIQFDPDQPLPPPPTLSVTPATGLLDGQRVTVTGSGFTPGTNGVIQCAAFVTSPEPDSCLIDNLVFAEVGPEGSFTAELVVEEFIDLPTNDIDCRPPGSCVVFSSPFSNATNGARFPLSFAAGEPGGPGGAGSGAGGSSPTPGESGPLVTPRFTG